MKNSLARAASAFILAITFVMCSTEKKDETSGNTDISVKQQKEMYVKACWPSYLEKEPSIDSIPFDLLTHLTHLTICFAYPNEDGTLNTSQIENIDKLVSKSHQNGIKAILNIGGAADSENFSKVSIDSVLREKFISNLTKYVIEHKLDGVEIDWEWWPTPEKVDTTVSNGIVALFSDLRSTLPKSIHLSYDVYPTDWYGKHYPTELIDYADEIVIMVFAYAGAWSEIGHHSPPSKVEESYNYWIDRIGKENNDKIVIATPFFGHYFKNNHTKGNQNTCHYIPYCNIVRDYPEAYFNDTIRTDSSVIFHNGIRTYKEKIDFIKNHDLKGISVWQIGHDTTVNGKSLLKFIHNEVNKN